MVRAFAVLAVGLSWAAAAGAQVETAYRTACHLPVSALSVAPTDAQLRLAVPDCDPAAEGAQFVVEYIGFPPGAEAAFQAALNVWACRVRSDQPIRVRAEWSPLDSGTLGSAGPFLVRNFGGAPIRDVWYPSALADALAGRDLGDGDPDIEAFFNSDFRDWHFGPGPPQEGTYDLTTVVLHEIGHGLGLIGNLSVRDGLGVVGQEPEGPFSYDLHALDAVGAPLLDPTRYPDGSARLADALTEEVGFTGRAVTQVGSPRVPLYAPPQFIRGGSYSHLDEDAYAEATPDGLMTPFIARGEVVEQPGTTVCAMLADVGWTLAGDCADRVGALPPVVAGVAIEQAGLNPFTGRTAVRLSTSTIANVRVGLVDALGRRVADYGTAVVVGGAPTRVEVDGLGLAAGVYFLTVEGGGVREVLPLTIVR